MKKVINLTILLLTTFAYSQTQEVSAPGINIIPPTPEVASLGKYIETPINEFTGIPKIQIPIYEINQNRINHSINLSYHAQGVKVEEIASRVGMGWTLNAGGVIHRQKRSTPDELPQYGYLKTTETVEEFLNLTIDPKVASDHLYLDVLFSDHNAHEKDMEPDLFIFSFGEYSGRFFFNQETKKPIFEEASPLKVEWMDYAYFKITTPDGIQYYFGENKERTSTTKQIKGGQYDAMDVWTIGSKYSSSPDETDPSVTNNPEYVATWYLKEIYDPISDQSITFDYEEYKLGKLYQRLSSSILVEETPVETVSSQHTLSDQESEEYVLTQINFNQGKIEFIKNTNERKDLSGSYALKWINIHSNDNLIKSYGFSHTEIESSNVVSSEKDLGSFYENLVGIKYRLFLTDIKEYGIDKINNTVLQNKFTEYTFEYSNPEDLPHRFSEAQDFWGFHNGVTRNKNLIPRELKLFWNGARTIGEANRMINETHAQDGVLTKITYPTGGATEYFYENNRVKKDVDPKPNYEGHFDPIYYNYQSTAYTFNHTNAEYNYNNGNPYYVANFTLDDFQTSSLNTTQLINFNYSNHNNYALADTNQEEPYWEAFIQKFDEQTNSWFPFGSRVYNFNDAGENEVALTAGNYRIIVHWINETSGSWNPNIHGNADWSVLFNIYEKTDLSDQDYILAGGLRVKKIKTYDANGNAYLTDYSYDDAQGKATGNLVSLPYRLSGFNFYYYDTKYGGSNGGNLISKVEYVAGKSYSSDSSVPLATSQSSYVGYDKVTKIREGGDNGKTSYNFSFERNTLDMTTLHHYPKKWQEN